jgi:hypothetical protein
MIPLLSDEGQMTDEELFKKYLPALNEVQVSQTVSALGPVVSFEFRRAPNGLVIQFATTSGSSEPMLLNHLVARSLRLALADQGF